MSKGFITGTNEELIKAYKESRDESYLKELIEANKGLINLLVSPYLTSILWRIKPMERWAYEYFRRQAIEDRCKQEAQWLIDNPKDSIRKVAREFCISKSQLHRDLHELRNIDDDLYVQCRNILRRHRRSGGKVR